MYFFKCFSYYQIFYGKLDLVSSIQQFNNPSKLSYRSYHWWCIKISGRFRQFLYCFSNILTFDMVKCFRIFGISCTVDKDHVQDKVSERTRCHLFEVNMGMRMRKKGRHSSLVSVYNIRSWECYLPLGFLERSFGSSTFRACTLRDTLLFLFQPL